MRMPTTDGPRPALIGLELRVAHNWRDAALSPEAAFSGASMHRIIALQGQEPPAHRCETLTCWLSEPLASRLSPQSSFASDPSPLLALVGFFQWVYYVYYYYSVQAFCLHFSGISSLRKAK